MLVKVHIASCSVERNIWLYGIGPKSEPLGSCYIAIWRCLHKQPLNWKSMRTTKPPSLLWERDSLQCHISRTHKVNLGSLSEVMFKANMCLEYVDTAEQAADIFAKALPIDKWEPAWIQLELASQLENAWWSRNVFRYVIHSCMLRFCHWCSCTVVYAHLLDGRGGPQVFRPLDYIVVHPSSNSFPCKLYTAAKTYWLKKNKRRAPFQTNRSFLFLLVDLARRFPTTTRSLKGFLVYCVWSSCLFCTMLKYELVCEKTYAKNENVLCR